MTCMKDEREVLGVWTYESGDIHAPRNNRHRSEREAYIYKVFGREATPAFIWRIDFFKALGEYGITLHRFAQNAEGRRYHAWVKAYDEHGSAVTTRLAAVLPPENHRITELPPEWLLFGNLEPQ
jgi:hypothetical protein